MSETKTAPEQDERPPDTQKAQDFDRGHLAFLRVVVGRVWAMTNPGTPRWGRREKAVVREILGGKL